MLYYAILFRQIIDLCVHLPLSPVSGCRSAVVWSQGQVVVGRLALHYYVFPKFLFYQWTGYSTYQSIKLLHWGIDWNHDNNIMRPTVRQQSF